MFLRVTFRKRNEKNSNLRIHCSTYIFSFNSYGKKTHISSHIHTFSNTLTR
uniref:Uncharacterized protein n=1 Tax=Anguilla anguilla TaxID=7936 RepID=A0A0E9P8S4_ANGAN